MVTDLLEKTPIQEKVIDLGGNRHILVKNNKSSRNKRPSQKETR